jgi:dihydroorotase
MRTAILLLTLLAQVQAQQYDLLLKGGHVIDPANQRNAVMDVAVTGTTVARVAPSIAATEAKRVIDVSGRYVTPGLIDLHFHSTRPCLQEPRRLWMPVDQAIARSPISRRRLSP